MRNSNYLVAAAVAAALGTGLAQADQPTLAQVQAVLGTAPQIYMGGSSAAKNGLQAFIAKNYCAGGTLTTFESSTVSSPDFNVWACTATIPGVAAVNGVLTLFHYRAEGGSFTGVYPIINNVAVNTLDLSVANTTCSAAGAPPTYACQVAGTALANGSNDTWGAGANPSGVSKVKLDLGVSDLEPDAFVGDNSPYAAGPPSGYVAGTFGPAKTQAQLKAMSHTTIFQQTFGVIVNAALGTNLDISRQAIANILNGSYTDWGSVPAMDSGIPGATLTAAGHPVILCNRERGSGTRTASSIFFLGDHCSTEPEITNETASATYADSYSTGADITCVQTNGASNNTGAAFPTGSIAIGYASVDNNTSSKLGATAVFVKIDGILPTNYNTAIGNYGFAYEASAQANTASGNAVGVAVAPKIISALQALTSAPQSAQINVLPGQPATNLPQIPLQVNGLIYTTDFFRGGGTGNSCNGLSEAN